MNSRFGPERSAGRHGRGGAPRGESGVTRHMLGGRGASASSVGSGQNQGSGGGRSSGRGPGHGSPHGGGPFRGHPHGRGPWSRARRGDVRTAILLALAGEPMHGYQIMQRLEERSGGAWRPSPGSVYPTLQLLEDQGFIKGEEADGRRVFTLTETGVAEAASIKARVGDSPWGTEGGEPDPRFALRQAVFQLGAAVKQVGKAGSPELAQSALEILQEARKRIYGLLADAE